MLLILTVHYMNNYYESADDKNNRQEQLSAQTVVGNITVKY